MAIDPDMQPIIDAITARLDAIEASGGNVDLSPVLARLDAADRLNTAVVAYNARLSAQLVGRSPDEMADYLDTQAV